MTYIADRRQRRSDDASLALRYQLDAIRGRGAEAALVVDDSGLCLASSGDRALCEELAAWVPLLGGLDVLGAHSIEVLGRPVTLRRVSIDDADLFVCAVAMRASPSAALDGPASGVARILHAA